MTSWRSTESAEGAPIQFGQILILELPPGVTTPDQAAPALG
jgi:hypothetical protein